jgi:hypothetical protein
VVPPVVAVLVEPPVDAEPPVEVALVPLDPVVLVDDEPDIPLVPLVVLDDDEPCSV